MILLSVVIFYITLFATNNFNHFTMPYIIAVLALVLLGTGYTLFQKTDSPSLDTSPLTITEVSSTTEPFTITADTSNDSDDSETEENEAKHDDNPSPSDSNKPTATPSKPVPAPVVTNPTPAPADNNTYTNGTYYTTKSYRTPDGTYQMNVSLTVNNDKVTASTLSFDADGARDGYSKRFSNGYQNQVTGKDLGSVNLSRVGGASLTTNAFNSALSSIKSQAS